MAKGKVLIIDDSQISLDFTQQVLEDAGYEVITEDNAILGPGVALRTEPDVILVDINMPNLCGDKLAELLRGMQYPHTILLYSVKPEAELEVMAEECGADGFLQKTQDEDLIVAKIRSCMESTPSATLWAAGFRQSRSL